VNPKLLFASAMTPGVTTKKMPTPFSSIMHRLSSLQSKRSHTGITGNPLPEDSTRNSYKAILSGNRIHIQTKSPIGI